MKKQEKPFSIRLDPELMEIIKKEAEKQGRSINKQIEFWLKGRANDDRNVTA